MARKLLLRALLSTLLLATGTSAKVYNIPAAVSSGGSSALFKSTGTALDAPKVHPINGSSFDWWYFDVVSTDPAVALASVVVVFYTSAGAAFPFLSPSDSITRVQLSVSFPNGTQFTTVVDAEAGATVVSDGNVSSGNWTGTGFSWGHSGASYTVVIDAPQVGVQGSISFNSVAPAHYPCGPAEAGQDMQVAPGIGWANAVPDAVSSVELTVGDTVLSFTGAGYHDKNWSNELFTASVASWYWGHGRLGAYSLVWFDFLALDGTEYVSGYAARDGAIVAATCKPGSIRVRPTGQNDTYPPTLSTGSPSGYHITFDLAEAGTLEMDIGVIELLVNGAQYLRSVGNISGVVLPVNGSSGDTMHGTALYEEFKLIN
ncbi:hypothetical protein C8R46DRAFT_1297866 [Mycena filopes]|nr:hypothetical protein C8R46DRAFT_1297866 [Mycena filopes]